MSSSTIPHATRKVLEDRAKQCVATLSEKQAKADEFKESGNLLYKQKDYESAARFYAQAIELCGPRAVYLSNLAAALLGLEQYARVEEVASEALMRDPRMIKARYRRGVARKELHRLKAAKTDFETILREDPDCTQAQTELAAVRKLSEECHCPEDENATTSSSDDDWPHFNNKPIEPDAEWDSSDSLHVGNGIPCRFYNRGGCAHGEECAYSHAPDEKSVRDGVGKNVCVYFLLDMCSFGDQKCVYAHSKAYLSHEGWWNHPTQMAEARQAVASAEESRASKQVISVLLRGGPRGERRSRVIINQILQGESIVERGETKGKSSATKCATSAKAALSKVPSSKAFIMLLSLENEDFFADIHAHLLSALRAKMSVIQALTSRKALKLLASPDLAGVFVTDPGVADPKYSQVFSKLVEYAKAGGTVVIGGLFCSFISPPEMDAFFHGLGTSWKMASYHRTTFSLNQASTLAKCNPSLTASYSMKAVHLKNVPSTDAVYVSTEDSHLESHVFPAHQITDHSDVPVVYSKVGLGHVGYVGDVNAEKSSTTAILAMLKLLDAPREVPQTINNNTASQKPSVLLLSLEHQVYFDEINAHFLSSLRAKTNLLQALNPAKALQYISLPHLAGVLVTDVGIANRKNGNVLAKLVEYTKSGGKVVLGGAFSFFMDKDELETFFRVSWGLPWTVGSCHRTTFSQNPRNDLVSRNPSLPASYSMKALHLGGFKPEMAVYMPTKDSHLESIVFASEPITDLSSAPIVFTTIGRGRLGYVGDINSEDSSTSVILAMLDLLDLSG